MDDLLDELELLQGHNNGTQIVEGLEGVKFVFGEQGDGKFLSLLEGVVGVPGDALFNFNPVSFEVWDPLIN